MYEPHTERTAGCTVCTRYTSLISNAGRIRRDGSAPGVDITLREFATWLRTQPLRCTYCAIPEPLIQYLNLRTQVDQPLARLGIDRIDHHAPYNVSNIVLCCFACNKAKSNTFSQSEMQVIGAGIGKSWHARLHAAGISWFPLAS